MGMAQGIQPMLVEVVVRPTLMIESTASAATARAATKNTSQAASDPTVEGGEGATIRMLEVSKPATQRRIETPDDHRQTRPVVAFRFRADRVLEFLQALPPDVVTVLVEAVPQEVKNFDSHVHDFGFGRMQFQTVVGRPMLDELQRLGGFFRRAAQDHEVVGVAHHLETLCRQQVVQRIERDVAQQRREHASNKSAKFVLGSWLHECLGGSGE